MLRPSHPLNRLFLPIETAMPLKFGSSKKTRDHNIAEMIAAGHDTAQAVAAGYAEQRRARKKKSKGYYR